MRLLALRRSFKMAIIELTINDLDYVQIIENGNSTSMLKSTYDEQQAEAKAPKVVDEAAEQASA
jgi:hypothetical protein